MIRPFQFYIDEKLVVKTPVNVSMAKALLQKAEIRLNRVKSNKIEEAETSIVFEDIYECLREASQSLIELKGFKPYSHEALVAFLKDYKMLPDAAINIFDTYRILRNNSVYKAEKISLHKCLEALEFAKSILPELAGKMKEII